MNACACTQVTKEVLPNPVSVLIDDPDLDYASARLIADSKADELLKGPMLLGWYDAKRGKFSPDVECCSEEKPGWIVYAESRGGTLSVDINDEEYVFIYMDTKRP